MPLQVVAFLRKAEPVLEIMLYSDMFMGEEPFYDWEKSATVVNLRAARPVLLLKFAEGKLADSPTADKVELLQGSITTLDAATAVTLPAQLKAAGAKRREDLAVSLREAEEPKVRPSSL